MEVPLGGGKWTTRLIGGTGTSGALLGVCPSSKILRSQRLRESLSLLSGRADNPNECMPNGSHRNLHSYRSPPGPHLTSPRDPSAGRKITLA